MRPALLTMTCLFTCTKAMTTQTTRNYGSQCGTVSIIAIVNASCHYKYSYAYVKRVDGTASCVNL